MATSESRVLLLLRQASISVPDIRRGEVGHVFDAVM